MKMCTVCRESKPLEDFKRNAGTADGRTYMCMACLRARRLPEQLTTPEERRDRQLALLRERHQNDPEYRERLHAHRRKSVYGLTPEHYQALLDRQEGLCAICREKPKGKRQALHVDHDHRTGRIRGLLCFMCNRGLGDFVDSPDRLLVAADYLKTISDDDLLISPARRRKSAECGTMSGYMRHRKLGEMPCTDCLQGKREYERTMRRQRSEGRPLKRKKVAECGTPSGYVAHYKRGEKPCQPCRDAHAAENQRRQSAPT